MDRGVQVFPAFSGSELLFCGICSNSLHSASQNSCSLSGLLCSMKVPFSFPYFLMDTTCKAVRCDTVLPRFGEIEGGSDCIAGNLQRESQPSPTSAGSHQPVCLGSGFIAICSSEPHPSRPFSFNFPPISFSRFPVFFPGTSWPLRGSCYSSR